jgi:acyl dehydratase
VNPDVQGKEYPEVAFFVDPERVAAFRQVFGQAAGVPPTFATAAEFTVFPQIVADPELRLDLRRVLHGSQEYVHGRPLVEGETVTIRTRLARIRSKGGNWFLTIATELVGADGEIACTARSTMIERGEGE